MQRCMHAKQVPRPPPTSNANSAYAACCQPAHCSWCAASQAQRGCDACLTCFLLKKGTAKWPHMRHSRQHLPVLLAVWLPQQLYPSAAAAKVKLKLALTSIAQRMTSCCTRMLGSFSGAQAAYRNTAVSIVQRMAGHAASHRKHTDALTPRQN